MVDAAESNESESAESGSENSKDVLVVVSKLKNYIRAKSGMNTAANVAPKLSIIIQRLCDEAIQRASGDHRKTVMERDFNV